MYRVLLICGLLISGNLSAMDLTAVLDWQQRVELGTLVDGVVSKVNVTRGERVSRGTLMIELDQREVLARLAWAEARAAAAKLEKDEARRELDRALDLYDRTLISDHERKQAEVDAANADAMVHLADAELTQIRIERDYARIKAPFDGIVIALGAFPGQALVNRLQSQPLITLAATQRMKALSHVSQEVAGRLETGQMVKVSVRGEWIDGEIAFIGLEPEGQEYPLEVLFTPPEQVQLRAGETGTVRIDD